MATATLTPDRLRTFRNTRDDELKHPVDVLGRARYRAGLAAGSVHVTRSVDLTAAIPFQGTAILFNKRTWIGSREHGFWEQIAPEAVTKTLTEADVRFLQNHNPDLLLARTNPGMRADGAATLTLVPTPAGLRTEADMAPVSYAHDLAVLLDRGDISQMSFAFDPIDWTTEQLPGGALLVTITELRLYDVSVVTYPAYEETDAGLRAAAFDAICRDAGFEPDAVLRGYAQGGAMPELELAAAAAPEAIPAAHRTKRARLVEADFTRSLNGWTFKDLWPLLDAAIVDYCSTEDFNAYWYVWLIDINDEWFVFYDDRPGAGHSYWQVSYTVAADGAITLGTPVEVVGKTLWLEVTQAETDPLADEASTDEERSADLNPGDRLRDLAFEDRKKTVPAAAG